MIGPKAYLFCSLSCYRDRMDRWCSGGGAEASRMNHDPARNAVRRLGGFHIAVIGPLGVSIGATRHKSGKQAVILRTGLGRDRRLHAVRPPALLVPWKSGILRNIPRLPSARNLKSQRSHDTNRSSSVWRALQPATGAPLLTEDRQTENPSWARYDGAGNV